ncbi:MAG: hypothetical protein U0638_02685 [Phycisphaerales bacterium]
MNRRSLSRNRRGMAVAAVVIVLALINLVVIASLDGGTDDAMSAAIRVETVRAFYAAEAGSIIAVELLSEDKTTPTAGDVLSLDTGQITFTRVPTTGATRTLVIDGRSGMAFRRVHITAEVSE